MCSKWYRVAGTGTKLEASTCNDLTEFDTRINVYSGSCDALTCVGADDDSCAVTPSASRVAWDSVLGTDYFIVVHGASGSTGGFGISVEEVSG